MIIVSKPIPLRDLKESREIQVKVDSVPQKSFKFGGYSTVIDNISESYDMNKPRTVFRGMTCYFLYRNGTFAMHDGSNLIEISIPRVFTGKGTLLLAMCFVDSVLLFSSASKIREEGVYFYQIYIHDDADEEFIRNEVLMAKLSDNFSDLFLSEVDYPLYIREARFAVDTVSSRLNRLESEEE